MALRMFDGHSNEVERGRSGHDDSGFNPIPDLGRGMTESLNSASNKVRI